MTKADELRRHRDNCAALLERCVAGRLELEDYAPVVVDDELAQLLKNGAMLESEARGLLERAEQELTRHGIA